MSKVAESQSSGFDIFNIVYKSPCLYISGFSDKVLKYKTSNLQESLASTGDSGGTINAMANDNAHIYTPKHINKKIYVYDSVNLQQVFVTSAYTEYLYSILYNESYIYVGGNPTLYKMLPIVYNKV